MKPLMTSRAKHQGSISKWRPLVVTGLALGWTLATSQAAADVSQTPLLLGGGNVPGNLALVPSVEHPTVISVANLGAYNNSSIYTGYFDPGKCYSFIEEEFNHVFFGTISKANGGGYFTPASAMNSARDCSGNSSAKWSGNYLNWATTQTIDPFRKALTGGYRVVDTTSMTVLEKATRGNSSNYFGNRTINATNANKTTPFGSVSLTSSVTSGNNDFQKNKTVRFTYIGSDKKTVTNYFTVRVEVCKKGLLESNCTKYGENLWKPEGLIQQYSKDIRYSVFSYLNENGNTRNGGVMRAPQGYVGQTKRQPGTPNELPNELKEWSEETGVFYVNPQSDSIGNSGVINYINKFGELTNRHKSNDPVSELYYAALRYFRNLGDVAAYSNITDASQRDKFPVITNWADPIQYSCQKNVILGIGDVNTHEDRDVPVTGDPLKVQEFTKKVFDLEGIIKSASSEFTGRGNSAHIAGLAYYANTTDLRADRAGNQTVSTHWVDVREGETLLEKARNQYWLAAKYGGFQVPDDYKFGDTIDPAWWWTNGETLDPTNDERPDNFYVASDATQMVESLKTAFAKIAADLRSTTAALSTNSTRLDTGTMIFQSLLDTSDWSGDLIAKSVGTDGIVSETAAWQAAEELDAVADPANRDIFTSLPPTADTGTGALRSTTGRQFEWASLSDSQRLALRYAASGTPVSAELGEQRLDYIRGDRSLERTEGKPNNPFRTRGSRLGDIANSDPQFIHKQNFGYSQLPVSAGFTTSIRDAYTAFRTTTSYQSRPPLVVVGANDGMLHGFNASTDTSGGEELFAYVPNDLIDDLYELTQPTYSHRYYVDGTPRIGDALVNGDWRTIVVGSSGAGGRSIFALDISDPTSMTSGDVLWEFTHPEMGYSLGRPALVPLPNGKFGVIVSSGFERTTTETDGYIWVLDASDGSVIKRFDLPDSGDIGAPLAVDLDNDRVADRIYAADTKGNVWRMDMTGGTTSNWDAPSNLKSGTAIAPLFIARAPDGSRQPITAPLDAAYTKDREVIIVFGTGSFYRTTDNELPDSPQVQSFYGVLDRGNQLDGRSTLLEQEILVELNGDILKGRGISQTTLEASQNGWFLDLLWKKSKGGNGPQGERVISQAQLGGNRVTFSTLIPSDDPCRAGGTSWIMSLDLTSGGRLAYSYFDYNGDGVIDKKDFIVPGPGEDPIPVSGIADDKGVVKGNVELDDREKDKKYLCYASSASSTAAGGVTPVCIEVMSNNNGSNRLSWHEVRDNL